MSRLCQYGHEGPRRKNGNCIPCERQRYARSEKRRAYQKQLNAKKRAAIKADPEKLAAHQAYFKAYSSANRTKLSARSRELYQEKNIKIRLQRKGIEPTDEMIKRIENHSGFCDICSAPGDGRWKELSIDHCHGSGGFRGMLCSSCNRALGLFKDNPELLEKAMSYLIQYRKTLAGEFLPG